MIKKIVLIIVLLGIPAAALAAITQAFKTQASIPNGSIVSLADSADTVTAANPSNLGSLLGVVTDPGNGSQAQVATTGIVPVLVSNLNGDIQPGNPITVSAIDGVGELATSSTKIVGLAQATFSSKSPGAHAQTVTDTGGQTHQIFIGSIPMLVGVGNYAPSDASSSFVPPAVQSLFNAIAGRNVPPIRVIISLLILLVVIIVDGIILTTSIRSSLISMGRNPLARASLMKQLLQVLLVALALLVAAFLAVYFMVTR